MLRESTTVQCGSLEMKAAVVCIRAHYLLCDCMALVCCSLLYCIVELLATPKSKI